MHQPAASVRRTLAVLIALVAVLAACNSGTAVNRDQRSVPEPTEAPRAPAAPTLAPAEEPPTSQTLPTPVPTPTVAPTPTPPPVLPTPTPQPPVVSDEVPPVEELLDIGLTQAQAECFIATIDPDGTGRVESVERFVEALDNCT